MDITEQAITQHIDILKLQSENAKMRRAQGGQVTPKLNLSGMDPYQKTYARIKANRRVTVEDYTHLLGRIVFGSAIKSPTLAEKTEYYTLPDIESEIIRLKSKPKAPSIPAPQPLRIAFVGADSTGKSTIARWCKTNLNLPLINEVARQVIGELETNFPALRADLDATTAYQAEVFKRQVQVSLSHKGGYVSDRAHDNLVYAAAFANDYHTLIQSDDLARYLDHLEDVLIFFVRPHKSLLKNDGVRAPVKWRDIVRIDGMIHLLLRSLVVPKTGKPLRYFEIASPILLDRVELVRNVVALRV